MLCIETGPLPFLHKTIKYCCVGIENSSAWLGGQVITLIQPTLTEFHSEGGGPWTSPSPSLQPKFPHAMHLILYYFLLHSGKAWNRHYGITIHAATFFSRISYRIFGEGYCDIVRVGGEGSGVVGALVHVWCIIISTCTLGCNFRPHSYITSKYIICLCSCNCYAYHSCGGGGGILLGEISPSPCM